MSQALPFNVAQAVSSLSSTANTFVSSSTAKGPTASTSALAFKVPAHKHAHHLHSIPPREKSTRTLIIDHMLWVHARTRFSQARAELGMTDRTGGPSSSNYIHRRRPENYEEEHEAGSEGEDVGPLKARTGRPDNPHADSEDDRYHDQDLSLARSLRMRAEGVERVVISMLEQPPPVHPITDEDVFTPPTSPRLDPVNGKHPHTLPDGVRLRLALATMINDLFARSAPPPPFRYQKSGDPTGGIIHIQPGLPPGLLPLSSISAYGRSSPPLMKPGPRPLDLYTQGADPETANSPPSFRCPRHLHTGCEICVEVKSAGRPGVGGVRGRSNSRGAAGGSSPSWPKGVTPDGGGVSGWQDGSGIGSGLSATDVDGNVLRRKNKHSEDTRSTKLTELISRFLRLSALVADELGREARDRDEAEAQAQHSAPQQQTAPASTSSQESSSYSHILRPSREWYTLLAGLLTRAVLEGYLTAGWRGFDAVECLLTCGLGFTEPGRLSKTTASDQFAELDPDELPRLSEAVKMLFPGLRNQRKDAAEEEYGLEMAERMRRFYDIPLSTPDVATHMEDLAWSYPAEPVERAAVRFCEAIARWRGKPELETYKQKPSSTAPMTIESLVHTSPTMGRPELPRSTKKPSIEVYFVQPRSNMGSNGWSGNKRPRSPEGFRNGNLTKRVHV